MIFKWVAGTWKDLKDSRIADPVMATNWHALVETCQNECLYQLWKRSMKIHRREKQQSHENKVQNHKTLLTALQCQRDYRQVFQLERGTHIVEVQLSLEVFLLHGCVTNEAYPQADITRTTVLEPNLEVKSLQLIWRSGTRRWNLQVPDHQMSCRDFWWSGTCIWNLQVSDHQMSCRDLTAWQGTRRIAPAMTTRWQIPSFPPGVSVTNAILG